MGVRIAALLLSFAAAAGAEEHDGPLIALGAGGARLDLPAHGSTSGALDLHLRVGKGLSDRIVLYGDLGTEVALFSGAFRHAWSLTADGQFFLTGDRLLGGLSLDAGYGIGGLSRPSKFYSEEDGSFGFVLLAGLAYNFHLLPSGFVSPELFAEWHTADHASAVGLRLNLLSYL